MTEQDILELIEKDEWMMGVLRTARTLNLPDWMIGAGFVRNKVWDHLHGHKNKEVSESDIDLIYFDPEKCNEKIDNSLSKQLKDNTGFEWEVINQARAHVWHNRDLLYKNTEEALSEWVETPTCVAVRLRGDESLELFAPHGIKDLVSLVVKKSPAFSGSKEDYINRITNKRWQEKWPKLKIINLE